jgi:hypothetical protein
MKRLVFFFAGAALIIGASTVSPSAQTLVPCNFPNGWNSTDAHRELAGIPNGPRHRCLVERRGAYEARLHRRQFRQ